MAVIAKRATLAEVPPKAEAFYAECLRQLKKSGIPFLLGGTYAVSAYTGIVRRTKDLDVFCRPSDFPHILVLFQKLGYETEVEDERWLAKVRQGKYFFDIIFNSTMALTPVTDQWFTETGTIKVYGTEVGLVSPTELLWSKMFIQDRYRYDGADCAHVILKQHEAIDWKRLRSWMEQHWEVLLIHLLNFRFIYPTERECVPRWLLDELLARLVQQIDLPVSFTKICRGRLFSRSDYRIDITEWGFADVVGEGERRRDQRRS